MSGLKKVGTTGPVFIPDEHSRALIEPGNCYLFVKIVATQVVYSGQFWEKAADLVITSQVAIDHPAFKSAPVFNIQKSRKIKKNTVDQLGLSSTLIGIVPATMGHFSISIQFILDKENRLYPIKNLIEENVFQKAASFIPGPSVIAETVSGLSRKLFDTFLSAGSKETVLQLDADFNVGGGKVGSGYYAVISTSGKDHPLPDDLSGLTFRNGQLLMNEQPVTFWNYVVFDLQMIRWRSRAHHQDQPWEQKLREAESTGAMASLAGNNVEKEYTFKKCIELLKEAQLLLSHDASYLPVEAERIIKVVFEKIRKQLFTDRSSGGIVFRGYPQESQIVRGGKEQLGISPDEDLKEINNEYLSGCEQDAGVLKSSGII